MRGRAYRRHQEVRFKNRLTRLVPLNDSTSMRHLYRAWYCHDLRFLPGYIAWLEMDWKYACRLHRQRRSELAAEATAEELEPGAVRILRPTCWTRMPGNGTGIERRKILHAFVRRH